MTHLLIETVYWICQWLYDGYRWLLQRLTKTIKQ